MKDKCLEYKRLYDESQKQTDKLWQTLEKKAWDSDDMTAARHLTSTAKRKYTRARKTFMNKIETACGARPELLIDDDTTSLEELIRQTLFTLRE
jgi:hypothetical protein